MSFPLVLPNPVSRTRHLFAIASAFTAVLIAGCGGGNMPVPGSGFSGNTSVTVLASSTANDKLSQFNLQITSLTLTNKAGATVDLVTTSPTPEFIHLNGSAEPIATVTIPQGEYTAATATVGSAHFTCISRTADGGLDTSEYAYGATPASQVSVTLPAPLTVTGTALGLSLDLQVSPSATFPSCVQTGLSTYSINPTFNLTSVPFTAGSAPALTGLGGLIATSSPGGANSIGSITLHSPDGLTFTVDLNSATRIQGVADAAALAAGMPVAVDASIQPDGSLLASRVEVDDSDTTNISVSTGPLIFDGNLAPVFDLFGRQEQGYLPQQRELANVGFFSFGGAVFQTSKQIGNQADLPFAASFTAANQVAGQNATVTTHATSQAAYPLYYPASTVTLVPQTIDGTVMGVATEGGFTTYAVALAPESLMPLLAVQMGQTTVLTDPSTVTVYADTSTKMRAGIPAVGTVARFNGLLFNDGGVLKLDCAWTDAGVTP